MKKQDQVAWTSRILDPRAQAVADRLQARAAAQWGDLLRHYLPKAARLLLGRTLDWSGDLSFYDDKLLPLDTVQAELLYLLVRASRARCAVEFGTSFGLSTLYLAAAMRDAGHGGKVIGTEIVAEKRAAATAHLAEAGLLDHVEIRGGDARVTLRDLANPVDVLLIDGWPGFALDVLRIVEPALADGALVVADNVGQFRGDLKDLVLRLTAGPCYRATVLPFKSGTLAGVFNRPAFEASIAESTPG